MEQFKEINYKVKRVIIFVDHANIFYNLLKKRIRIDFGLLKDILIGEYHLVGAFMYLGMPDQIPTKKKKFLKYITKAGYTIQSRPLSTNKEGQTRQKGIDIFIYRDIVELAEEDAYDKCILVSGDADFVDAVKKLKELDKQVEVWSFRDSLSKTLKKKAGAKNIRYLDDIVERLII